ncbi:MAG TPA: hypothetical protein VE961_22125 [Pyrinomonadaceae bacterium]|nr:hypothetical protein [Pyrinomonadaceae bacterium]
MASIAAHPATLVIIGFIFTGIFGTFITARWQRKEWDRQQGRLLQIKRIEQKQKIMEDLTRKVADSDATEQDVLIAFKPWWRVGDQGRDAIAKERVEAWRKQGGRDWRIETTLLKNQLGFFFIDLARGPKIRQTFDEILERREKIAGRMAVLVDAYSQGKDVRKDETMQDEIDDIDAVIKENEASLANLDTLILVDIQIDASVPHTIWDDLI